MASDANTGILLPYQRGWIEDKSRFRVANWSRQVGKTMTATLDVTLDALEADARGVRDRWVILSAGERQAREAMETGVKRHLRAMECAFKEVLNTDWLDDVNMELRDVVLPQGTRMSALPANPRTARGYTAHVLLDEFAHHDRQREIWTALFPVISKPGLRLSVISTPAGVGDKFHELMTTATGWSRHTTDIYQAVADGLPRDPDELRDAIGDERAWAQEYECKFLDDGVSHYLSYALIGAAQHDDPEELAEYRGGPCWVGMDIARRRDLTVIAVLEEWASRLWCRELVELRGATFAVQLGALEQVMDRYRVVRAALDQTGMGEMMVETAKEQHGTRIEGVLLTEARRLDVATALKSAMEDRRLRIPATQELRDDLRSMMQSEGATGRPRLVAQRVGGSHADRFWALALGAAAAQAPKEEFGYMSARRKPDEWRERPEFPEDRRRPGRGVFGVRGLGRAM